MHLRLIASTIFLTALVAACGGGGGSAGNTPPISPAVTATPTQTAQTTNASGTVVDDGTGLPLAGVTVKLMPWAPCGPTPAPATSITPENDGCPTPLPSPQATTASNGTFALNGAPNGHYLLVIGTDTVSTPPAGYAPSTCTNACPAQTAAPFTVQATVHDNVTLIGGNQMLAAPTLPQYSGVTVPTWETNGDYRLATLNETTEMPCYIGWQYERAQNSTAGSTVDEWLVENTRALIQATVNRDTINTTLTGPYGFEASGVPDCAEDLIQGSGFAAGPEANPNGANAYVKDPRAVWVSGAGYPVLTPVGASASSPIGSFGFMIDPRSSGATWP
jgi:hypothetical protein